MCLEALSLDDKPMMEINISINLNACSQHARVYGDIGCKHGFAGRQVFGTCPYVPLLYGEA